jgi:hypothetical protein
MTRIVQHCHNDVLLQKLIETNMSCGKASGIAPVDGMLEAVKMR